ncbi:MAG: dolichyl-phosphate beta-glucosyltransferase [Heterodermia speciosa]|uniref:dolichyl-phosphate beta-glucosyltransferase n=1 Tax=Heterodermia speciosa TaxID=116794 RepID=A0A8H3IWY2_9LECA|nr:MAG: dolichyl-phosphate beta-glucosyltransferase [Heterodermia speciosa]
MDILHKLLDISKRAPLPLVLSFLITTIVGFVLLLYVGLFIIAPIPREPLPSEKTFNCIDKAGRVSYDHRLPCWQDAFGARKEDAHKDGEQLGNDIDIEEPEVYMSLVVPAYNEQERLEIMLSEAVDYLRKEYGTSGERAPVNGVVKRQKASANGHILGKSRRKAVLSEPTGWEIIIVNDGSTDKTSATALDFAATRLGKDASLVRVVSLKHNRGKGGAVTHGMRHVRGKYAVFADADGASKFEDLGKLVRASQDIEDSDGRGVAVGSRAHLVGSEAVVKRSFLRNLLMHSFHLLLRLLTPPATAAIRDTQCGFKLFSRPSLPYIIPFMHCEGWIFDVEMLMLAELAGIPVAEVPVGWKEVKGSKLNVLWDSLGMAYGLALLRVAWGLGVYRRS